MIVALRHLAMPSALVRAGMGGAFALGAFGAVAPHYAPMLVAPFIALGLVRWPEQALFGYVCLIVFIPYCVHAMLGPLTVFPAYAGLPVALAILLSKRAFTCRLVSSDWAMLIGCALAVVRPLSPQVRPVTWSERMPT